MSETTAPEPDAQDLRAVCDLLRLAEPGDRLLKAGVLAYGPAQTRALAADTGQAEAARRLGAAADAAGLEVPAGALETALARWRMRTNDLDAGRDLRVMATIGARLLAPGCAEWVPGLSDLGIDEPLGLWVRGAGNVAALCRRAVAAVGARAASQYGTHTARGFGYELVDRGYTVISGGAYGIDAAAHAGALTAATRADVGTIGFLAGGVDRLYPRGNSELLTKIAQNYALVSEAPPGATAMRHRFLLRNRLIAASAQATIVVQAGYRSGAINTAHRAAELYRPVGAVPGLITSAEHAGCHRLIRDGSAVLVSSVEEVCELVSDLDPLADNDTALEQGQLRLVDSLSPEAQRVYSALPVSRGAEIATIAKRTGLDSAETRTALGTLTLQGLAVKSGSGWVKKRK